MLPHWGRGDERGKGEGKGEGGRERGEGGRGEGGGGGNRSAERDRLMYCIQWITLVVVSHILPVLIRFFLFKYFQIMSRNFLLF